MATVLRQVLDIFERASAPLSLGMVARELGVEQGILDGMIQHWIRKGRLREVSESTCGSCGQGEGCPFVTQIPRCYEVVREEALVAIEIPVVEGCPRCG